MIKAFLLILRPGTTWDKIAQAQRGFLFITVVHLLPVILAGSALEAWGLSHHGKWQPRFEAYKPFTQNQVATFEIVQFGLLIIMVLASALLVFKISQTFMYRLTFLQTFTTVVYGFSPFFLVRFMNVSAQMHPVVPWLLGMGLSSWVLYQGIPRVMQPDPTHAFGVYLSAMFVVVLTSALTGVGIVMYLLGYLDFDHSWIGHRILHFFGP